MGHWRFRKSVGNKFLRFNISKTGTSITTGVPGSHLNVPLTGRKRKPMATFSLPGTGLSYRQPLGGPRSGLNRVDIPWMLLLAVLILAFFFFGSH